jgi:hypothetical protein
MIQYLNNLIRARSTAFSVCLRKPDVIQISVVPSPEPNSLEPAERCLRTVMVILEEKYPQNFSVLLDFCHLGEISGERQAMVKMYCSIAQLVQVDLIALVGDGDGLEQALRFLYRTGKTWENTKLFTRPEEAMVWLRNPASDFGPAAS